MTTTANAPQITSSWPPGDEVNRYILILTKSSKFETENSSECRSDKQKEPFNCGTIYLMITNKLTSSALSEIRVTKDNNQTRMKRASPRLESILKSQKFPIFQAPRIKFLNSIRRMFECNQTNLSIQFPNSNLDYSFRYLFVSGTSIFFVTRVPDLNFYLYDAFQLSFSVIPILRVLSIFLCLQRLFHHLIHILYELSMSPDGALLLEKGGNELSGYLMFTLGCGNSLLILSNFLVSSLHLIWDLLDGSSLSTESFFS